MARPKLTRAQMRLAYEIRRDDAVKTVKRLEKLDPGAFEMVLTVFRARACERTIGGKLTRDAIWWGKVITGTFKRPIDPAEECPF